MFWISVGFIFTAKIELWSEDADLKITDLPLLFFGSLAGFIMPFVYICLIYSEVTIWKNKHKTANKPLDDDA